MAETAKAKLTGKMLGVLFIFGFVNAIMYTFHDIRMNLFSISISKIYLFKNSEPAL